MKKNILIVIAASISLMACVPVHGNVDTSGVTLSNDPRVNSITGPGSTTTGLTTTVVTQAN